MRSAKGFSSQTYHNDGSSAPQSISDEKPRSSGRPGISLSSVESAISEDQRGEWHLRQLRLTKIAIEGIVARQNTRHS